MPVPGAHAAKAPSTAAPAGRGLASPVDEPVAEDGTDVAGFLFASTNLIEAGEGPERRAGIGDETAEARRRLSTGRHQRTLKLYREATANLAGVLNLGAGIPDDLRRSALLELALVAQEQNELTRAVQVLAQYLSRWPKDPGVPEVLLRQGLILRQLGAYGMSLTKFYATMTSALVLKEDHFDHYRRLVLQAQAEIAETLVLQGKHREAGDAFVRLLRDDSPGLNRRRVHFRYLSCLAAEGRHGETAGQAREFLNRHPGSAEEPEVRFLLVTALKRQGQTQEALQETLRLLQSQQGRSREDPGALAYWQQRTGNDLANQLYQEGDLVNALTVYQSLRVLSPVPSWRLPVQYQIGLVYERLEQPTKAVEAYAEIVAAEADLGSAPPASLKVLLDMARWRRDFLQWQMKTDVAQRVLKTQLAPAPEPPKVAAVDGSVPPAPVEGAPAGRAKL